MVYGVIMSFQWLIAFGVVVAGHVACAASVPVGVMVMMQVGSIRYWCCRLRASGRPEWWYIYW